MEHRGVSVPRDHSIHCSTEYPLQRSFPHREARRFVIFIKERSRCSRTSELRLGLEEESDLYNQSSIIRSMIVPDCDPA